MNDKTVKCPICGKLYIVVPYKEGDDQSVCPSCRREAEENMKVEKNIWKNYG